MDPFDLRRDRFGAASRLVSLFDNDHAVHVVFAMDLARVLVDAGLVEGVGPLLRHADLARVVHGGGIIELDLEGDVVGGIVVVVPDDGIAHLDGQLGGIELPPLHAHRVLDAQSRPMSVRKCLITPQIKMIGFPGRF